MGRKGPNEVRGGPNRVSSQRRRRLCRALRGALCGVLREGTRGCAGVCRGVECVGTGRVAGRRGAGVVVVSCGWSLARLLRDCCGRLAGCGGSWVQAGAAVAGTCCGSGCFGEGMLRGRNASGGGMRGDCRFCCGMGRRMDVEELTGRRGFCPRGGLSGWKADGAQRRKGRS